MSPPSPGTESGILPVDKPPGPTSHDIVARARRALGIRRVGHTGTLDPFASGLLLLCVGRATRIAEYLKDLPKEYEAEARLGLVTTTCDPEGEVIREEAAWRTIEPEAVEQALLRFRGRSRQVPPRYSAKKIGGEAAHRRARRGERVELAPVDVEIEEVELLDLDLPRVRFRIRCSAGTYIRAVARDLGEGLGVGAHLTRLRRTAVGSFRVGAALQPDELEDDEALRRAWIGPLEALRHLHAVEVEEDEERRLSHGRRIAPREGTPARLPIVLSRGGRLVALGRADEGGIRPVKVFPS